MKILTSLSPVVLLLMAAFLTVTFLGVDPKTNVLWYAPLKVAPIWLLAFEVLKFGVPNYVRKWVFWGLILSGVGDVAIIFVFEAGLGAFLVAHVFYILALWPKIRSKDWAYPVLALCFDVAMYLGITKNAPQELLIPVMVYQTVISAMLFSAVWRANKPSENSFPFRLFAIGAALFAFSDTIIAVNKFIFDNKFPFAAPIIMTTYYLGQFWISRAAIGPLWKDPQNHA
jgi:uncharacterized membrane protein YhhN